jgi:hypothetical protein
LTRTNGPGLTGLPRRPSGLGRARC